jgi:membrane protease YdiL (CAAX protease family)
VRKWRLRKESRNVLVALGIFVLSIVLLSFSDGLIIVYYAQAYGLSLEESAIATTKLVIIVNELLFAFLAIFSFTKIFKRTLNELGITLTKLLRNITVGIVIGIGGWFAGSIIAVVLARLVPFNVPEQFIRMLTPISGPDLAYFLILTWVLVGPCEELFFRGFIQGTFESWKGSAAGIIAGSILFGLAHFNPTLWFRTIPAGFLGIIYGVLYTRRKSIVPVAVAHSLNDTIGFVLAFLVR